MKAPTKQQEQIRSMNNTELAALHSEMREFLKTATTPKAREIAQGVIDDVDAEFFRQIEEWEK